jgi:hypothetical protein
MPKYSSHRYVQPIKQHLWRFVLLAFVLSSLLPFFAVYSMPSAATVKASLFSDRILICTEDGFRWITRSEASRQKPHTPNNHYQCALCFVAAHGLKHLVLAAAILLAVLLQISAARVILVPAKLRATRHTHHRHSRAPPFSL